MVTTQLGRAPTGAFATARAVEDEQYVEAQSQIRRLAPVMALHDTLTKRQLLQLAAVVIPAYVTGLPRLLAHWQEVNAAKAKIEQQRTKQSAS